MLDANVVLSKVGADPQRLTLSPTAPEVIVDPGAGTASVAVQAGAVLTATIDNAFQPGAWAASANPQPVAANTRRAFKLGGPGHAPIVITWS